MLDSFEVCTSYHLCKNVRYTTIDMSAKAINRGKKAQGYILDEVNKRKKERKRNSD
jgi:hypothetical protein